MQTLAKNSGLSGPIPMRKRLNRLAVTSIAVLVVTFTATGSYANCSPMTGMKSPVIKLPWLATADVLAGEEGMPSPDSPNSIVGLWHVVYTAGGSTFAETLKQWHSDGTEFENINHNPALGSVCLGVWKHVSHRTFRLHHVGFLFNLDGTSAGSFTNDETDRLAADRMSYSGTFTFTTFDVSGNITGTAIQGTIAATRITVN
jgi:hypothetical protein